MAWSSRGCFWGEYFSPNISNLHAFPASFHLMYFHFSLRIFFTYRLVLEIWVISRTSRYNNEGNALYILRIISRSEYTRDGLDTSPQFIAFFSEVFVVEDGA